MRRALLRMDAGWRTTLQRVAASIDHETKLTPITNMDTTYQFPIVNGQPVIIELISGQWAFVSFSDGSEAEVRISQIDFTHEETK